MGHWQKSDVWGKVDVHCFITFLRTAELINSHCPGYARAPIGSITHLSIDYALIPLVLPMQSVIDAYFSLLGDIQPLFSIYLNARWDWQASWCGVKSPTSSARPSSFCGERLTEWWSTRKVLLPSGHCMDELSLQLMQAADCIHTTFCQHYPQRITNYVCAKKFHTNTIRCKKG